MGGFWWVLAGSGGFWWALRWVLELNNDTSKIIEIHCKKQCFGLRRLPFRASGFGWVLAGSGRVLGELGGFWSVFWVSSGWVLELKNTTLKSLKFMIKTVFWAHETARWSENGL